MEMDEMMERSNLRSKKIYFSPMKKNISFGSKVLTNFTIIFYFLLEILIDSDIFWKKRNRDFPKKLNTIKKKVTNFQPKKIGNKKVLFSSHFPMLLFTQKLMKDHLSFFFFQHFSFFFFQQLSVFLFCFFCFFVCLLLYTDDGCVFCRDREKKI